MLDGLQLYRDLWDNKPPGVFYIYAALVKVFGQVMWSVGVVDMLCLLVMSYFVFRFAERYLSTAAAVIAVAFNADWHCQANYVFAAQPETFLMLFVFGGIFLVSRQGRGWVVRQFAGGMFLAAACWTKYNALAFLPLILLLPYWETGALDGNPPKLRLRVPGRVWLARAAVFLGGFVAVGVFVLARFWLGGSWAAFREVQFEVLPRYVAMGLENTPYYWLRAALRTQWWIGLWTELAVLASLCVAWRLRELGRLAPVFMGAALGYASAALQVRFHPYYFETCIPFFAMFWGYLGVKIYQGAQAAARECTARGWRLARALVWVVFANIAFWPLPEEFGNVVRHYEALREWRVNSEAFYSNYPWPHPLEHLRDQLQVVRFLKENSSTEDTVYVWGTHPLIYHLSGRRHSTRFVSNLALISPWGPPAWREELVRSLEHSPPRFIVVARRDAIPSVANTRQSSEEHLCVFPGLANFLTGDYRIVATYDDFLVYRRES